MTTSNYLEEKNALAKIFADAWNETEISWPGKSFITPDADTESWVEFYVNPGEASQASIGVPGSNLFRHPGIVSILVYVPEKKGEEEALRLADLAASVYRDNVSVPEIRFNAPSINKRGVVDGYTQINVTIPFNRDSFL